MYIITQNTRIGLSDSDLQKNVGCGGKILSRLPVYLTGPNLFIIVILISEHLV